MTIYVIISIIIAILAFVFTLCIKYDEFKRKFEGTDICDAICMAIVIGVLWPICVVAIVICGAIYWTCTGIAYIINNLILKKFNKPT